MGAHTLYGECRAPCAAWSCVARFAPAATLREEWLLPDRTTRGVGVAPPRPRVAPPRLDTLDVDGSGVNTEELSRQADRLECVYQGACKESPQKLIFLSFPKCLTPISAISQQ